MRLAFPKTPENSIHFLVVIDGNESGISILKPFKKRIQEKTRPAHLHPTSSHSNLSIRFQLSRWHSISDDHRVRKTSPW